MKKSKLISEIKNTKPRAAFDKGTFSKQKLDEIQFNNFLNSKDIKQESNNIVRNGLAEAIGFNEGGTFSFFGTQLSQVNTLFNNNRWYLISNMRQLLSELYVENGLIQTIIDLPVDDGFRGGIEISSNQLSEEQIKRIQVSLDRDDDINTLAQAIKWNRLFGGAGIVIMTDQDPESPLDLDALSPDSPLEFRAVDLWELFWDKLNTEGYDPAIQTQDFEYYDYYAVKLHKSRVMRLKGLTAPSFIRPRLRSWGFSVVEHLVRSINQYLKANNLSFEVLDEFKIDVFKIEGLASTLLTPNGQQQIERRVQLANWQKNYQHAITMDMKDDYVQKQLSFAGISDIMREIRMQIACDMRMPLTKLFGISAAGFNSGEDDIENYNAMVEGQVRNKSKYDALRMIEIKCQREYGFIPTDLEISFKPLRVLNSVDEETVKTSKFGRLTQAVQMGQISSYEFRDACNRDKLLGIQLDTSMDMLKMGEDSNVMDVVPSGSVPSLTDKAVDDGNPDPRKTTGPSIEDPGANREDTRKPRAWDYGSTRKNNSMNIL